MKRLLSISALVVLVVGASCDRKPAEERPSGLKNMAPLPLSEQVIEGLDVEPNDNFLQAVNVSLTGDSMQWRGSLSGGDVDVWRIKAKYPRHCRGRCRYHCRLCGDGFGGGAARLRRQWLGGR